MHISRIRILQNVTLTHKQLPNVRLWSFILFLSFFSSLLLSSSGFPYQFSHYHHWGSKNLFFTMKKQRPFTCLEYINISISDSTSVLKEIGKKKNSASVESKYLYWQKDTMKSNFITVMWWRKNSNITRVKIVILEIQFARKKKRKIKPKFDVT